MLCCMKRKHLALFYRTCFHLCRTHTHCVTTTLCFVRLLAGWLVRYQQMEQLCLCCSNAPNKVCYSAGFPKQAWGWRSDCLPDWYQAVDPALLTECHHGKPPGLPSCHSTRTDKVRIVQCTDLNAHTESYTITGEFRFTVECLQPSKYMHADSSSLYFLTWNETWQAHNETEFFCTDVHQIQTVRSHGGLSSRSNNHIGPALLLRSCPAHSVWPVGLKKISSHCRPDWTRQPQQGQGQLCSTAIWDHG